MLRSKGVVILIILVSALFLFLSIVGNNCDNSIYSSEDISETDSFPMKLNHPSWYTDEDFDNMTAPICDMSGNTLDASDDDWPTYDAIFTYFYNNQKHFAFISMAWDGQDLYFYISINDPNNLETDTGFMFAIFIQFPDLSTDDFYIEVTDFENGIYNTGGISSDEITYDKDTGNPRIECEYDLSPSIVAGTDLGICFYYHDYESDIIDTFPMYYDGGTEPDQSYGTEWAQLHLLDDTESPQVALQEPTTEGNYNYTYDTREIEWTASDNYAIDHFDILNNNSLLQAGLSSGIRSYNIPDLGEGVHNITVIVYDTRDNWDTSYFWLVVDKTSPIMDIISPVNLFNCTSQYEWLNWSVSDSLTWVDSIFVFDNETNVSGQLSGDVTSFELSLSQGLHNITIVAYDVVGNMDTDTIWIRRDGITPNIEFLTPVEFAYLDSSEVTVSWIVNDSNPSSDIYRTLVYLDELLNKSKLGIISEVDWLLFEGEHNVTIVVEDYAGNIESSTIMFYVDLSNPDIQIIKPSADIYLSNSSYSFIIEWTASDNVAIDYFELWIGSTSYIFESDVRMYEPATITSTTAYTLKIFDKAGHVDSDGFVVYFDSSGDTSPPLLSIENPVNETYCNSDVLLSWVASDAECEIRYVNISLDGTLIHSTTESSGSYTLEFEEEGVHNLFVITCNDIGLTKNRSIVIFYDITPPTITIQSPNNNQILINSNFLVTWIGDDEGIIGSIDYYEIFLGSLSLRQTESNTYAFSDISDGEYSIRVIIHDKAGNIAEDSVTIWVDVGTPTLSLVNPANSFTHKKSDGNLIRISCLAQDSASVSSVVLYLTGIDNEYSKTLNFSFNPSTGHWEVTWDITEVEYGLYYLNVTVHDLAGHSNSIIITSELVPPTPLEILKANAFFFTVIGGSVTVIGFIFKRTRKE